MIIGNYIIEDEWKGLGRSKLIYTKIHFNVWYKKIYNPERNKDTYCIYISENYDRKWIIDFQPCLILKTMISMFPGLEQNLERRFSRDELAKEFIDSLLIKFSKLRLFL